MTQKAIVIAKKGSKILFATEPPFNVFRQDSMTVIALELSFMWTGSIILVVLGGIASCFSVIFP
jgi:hypothetical protein